MNFSYDEDTMEVFGEEVVNRVKEIISNTENKRIKATPYLFNIQKQKKVHKLFFEKNYMGNKGDRILEFGPGSGVGRASVVIVLAFPGSIGGYTWSLAP